MAKKKIEKGTIYQQLNKFFNIGVGFDDIRKTDMDQTRTIIKGATPSEIEKKALELQQKKQLQDKFFRTTDRGFQKALQYEAARLPAYIDYEGMEYYPLIASALDLFMEETTTIGENGRMLNVYSSKDRIKHILEEFFYEIANVNVNLPFWARNMCKYGDNFVLQYGEKGKGITHIKQLVNYEIERYERIQDGKPTIKFKDRMTGDEFNIFEVSHFRLLGDDKFLPYGSSILNKVRRVFRQCIMAEDAMLTYRIVRAGEKKVFKIDVGNIDDDDIEDYVYKIATKFKRMPQVNPNDGQIDYRFNILGNDEDYFLPMRSANSQTGIETLPGACLSLDTKIDLLDGRSLPLNEIISEYEKNKELWSYSINPKSGEIVPGKITWAGITRKNTNVLKLTLNNGKTIICTPDHKFPLKYGGEKKAQDLKEGDSLWSFNKKTKKLKTGNADYEMIYDHKQNEWVYTHRMVDDYLRGKILKEHVRHHIDFNRFNNNPENLLRMKAKDHFILHSKYSTLGGNAYKEKYEKDVDFKKRVNKNLLIGREKYLNRLKNDLDFSLMIKGKQSDSRKKYLLGLNNDDYKKAMMHLYTPESRKKAVESFKGNPDRSNIIERIRRKSIITKNKKDHKLLCSNNTKNLWKNNDFRKAVIDKQKIKYSKKLIDLLIEYLNDFELLSDVLKYRVNIDNYGWLCEFNDLNKDNKQLKKLTKITRNNIDKMLKHYGYKNFRDFKSKIAEYNHKIIKIERLSEKQDTGTLTIDGNEDYHNFHNFALSCGVFTKNSNLDAIQDIEYLRDNLFMGLGIPKPFLSFQDAVGGGKNLAQFDVRFTKKINRIQQAMIQELNKMAVIHLYLLGYRDNDLGNFTLTLTNPSTQHELLKAELFREKAQTYGELTRNEGGIAPMSHTKAKRYLFNMTDREIVEDLKQQKMEMAIKQELQDSPVVIKHTGLFKDIDDRYGEPIEGRPIESGDDKEGEEGGLASLSPGGDTEGPPGPPGGGPGEDFGEIKLEHKKRMGFDEYTDYVKKYMGVEDDDDEKTKKIITELDEKNKLMNTQSNTMINEIDGLLNDKKFLTKKQTEKDEDCEIENIDDLELDDSE